MQLFRALNSVQTELKAGADALEAGHPRAIPKRGGGTGFAWVFPGFA